MTPRIRHLISKKDRLLEKKWEIRTTEFRTTLSKVPSPCMICPLRGASPPEGGEIPDLRSGIRNFSNFDRRQMEETNGHE